MSLLLLIVLVLGTARVSTCQVGQSQRLQAKVKARSQSTLTPPARSLAAWPGVPAVGSSAARLRARWSSSRLI